MFNYISRQVTSPLEHCKHYMSVLTWLTYAAANFCGTWTPIAAELVLTIISRLHLVKLSQLLRGNDIYHLEQRPPPTIRIITKSCS